MFNNHLMKVCLAAVFAIGLAACSSSSDQATAPDPMPTEPTTPAPDPEPTPVSVTIPDAMYLDADNTPMAGTLMISAGMTATRGGVTFLCAEGGDDCEVTIAGDGSAMATGGTVTASLTADAMDQVAEAKKEKSDADEAARLIRRNRVIGEDRALETAATLPASGTASTDSGLDRANILAVRGPAGPATIVVTGPAGYSKVTDLMNGTWGGTRLSRVAGANTDEFVAFTDRAAPVLVQFYNFDRDADTASRYVDTSPPTGDDPYGPGDTLTPLSLVATGTAAAGRFTGAVLDSSEFPQPGPTEGGVVTEEYDVVDGTSATSFRGNYNGAGGTYTCDSGTNDQACVVTVTPAGTYASPDTWTFTPELNARAYAADGTFMTFGWWLRTPQSPDGTYDFEYYVDGTAFVPTTTAPTGTATYTGRAAGRYVVQEVDGTGVVDGVSGEFTAAASLTANFSALDTGGNPAPTVAGTISGFQGDMDGMSGWLVTLNGQALANNAAALGASFSSSDVDPGSDGFDGATALMGDQTAYGSWTGQFFGNAATIADGDTGTAATSVDGAAPIGIGGTFQADNESVNIAGAFGANR